MNFHPKEFFSLCFLFRLNEWKIVIKINKIYSFEIIIFLTKGKMYQLLEIFFSIYTNKYINSKNINYSSLFFFFF